MDIEPSKRLLIGALVVPILLLGTVAFALGEGCPALAGYGSGTPVPGANKCTYVNSEGHSVVLVLDTMEIVEDPTVVPGGGDGSEGTGGAGGGPVKRSPDINDALGIDGNGVVH